MNNRKQLSRILPRDSHLCGIHVGGCGKQIKTRTEATVDHIFTKSFFKDREDSVRPKDYNKDWNLQPMHQQCNGDRGGQIYGFPLFTCACHWLRIDKTPKGHILTLHHRIGKPRPHFRSLQRNTISFSTASLLGSSLPSSGVSPRWKLPAYGLWAKSGQES